MIRIGIYQHKDNEICPKCNQVVLLGKYCSVECLKDTAKAEGKTLDEAMQEMYEVAKALDERRKSNK